MTVNGVFPTGAKVLLLGQAPGKEEVIEGRPFVGPAGRELDRWLAAAGLDRRQCAITNLFNERLPAEGLDAITTPEARELPPIKKGRYLCEDWEHHLERLTYEIARAQPNIVIAFGSEALWAISDRHEISRYRGALLWSKQGCKAIATFHPSYMLRGGGKFRTVAMADVLKAKINADTPTLDFPQRELWLNPTITDLAIFQSEHLDPAEMIFFDIETNRQLRQITHVAFAPSRYVSLCVPLSWKSRSYWPTAAAELAALRWVRDVLASPIPKCAQNGLYDIGWFWFQYRFKVRNYLHDTRLMSHALFPELPKDLGFLGSLWENEQAWKMLGAHHQKGDD